MKFGQLKISKDTGKNIIKIMGNAPCQGTDGFHFLGLPETGFNLFFFCYVNGQLKSDITSVRPANDPVHNGKCFVHYGIVKFPSVNFWLFFKDLFIAAKRTGRIKPLKLPVTYFADQLMVKIFFQGVVNIEYFMCIGIGYENISVQAVKYRQQLLSFKFQPFFRCVSLQVTGDHLSYNLQGLNFSFCPFAFFLCIIEPHESPQFFPFCPDRNTDKALDLLALEDLFFSGSLA